MKLTLQSISKLIKVCKANGVAEFKNGDLCLRFDSPAQAIQATTPIEVELPPATRPAKTPDLELIREQVLEAEEDESLMILEDPESFEEKLAAGEMSDGPRSAQN